MRVWCCKHNVVGDQVEGIASTKLWALSLWGGDLYNKTELQERRDARWR